MGHSLPCSKDKEVYHAYHIGNMMKDLTRNLGKLTVFKDNVRLDALCVSVSPLLLDDAKTLNAYFQSQSASSTD